MFVFVLAGAKEGGAGVLHIVVWGDIALDEELHPLGAGETRRKVDGLGVGGHGRVFRTEEMGTGRGGGIVQRRKFHPTLHETDRCTEALRILVRRPVDDSRIYGICALNTFTTYYTGPQYGLTLSRADHGVTIGVYVSIYQSPTGWLSASDSL